MVVVLVVVMMVVVVVVVVVTALRPIYTLVYPGDGST